MAPPVSIDSADVAFDPAPPAIDTKQPWVTDQWTPLVRFDLEAPC